MGGIDWELRKKAVRDLLKSFPKEAVEGDSVTEETPHRVANMWSELLSGYEQKPVEIMSKTFDVGAEGDTNANGIVTVSNIQFYSCCEHHLVPFYGRAHIAYIPRSKVLGLSKFARLVEVYARRLQTQERITKQLIDDIEEYLQPLGAMVVLEAEHLCMTMRGIQKPGTITRTSRVSGVFYDKPAARDEAMRLMGL